MLERVADLLHRRPKRVLLGALVFVAVCGAFGAPVVAKLSTASSNFEDSGSQSVEARNLLERATGASPDVGLVVLVRAGADVHSSAVRTRVTQVAATIRRDPAVAAVHDLYTTGSTAFVSSDGRSTYIAASFKSVSDTAQTDAAKRIQKGFRGDPRIIVGGSALANSQVGSQVGKDLGMAEGLATPILLILLFFVFRGVVSAVLPLAGAVVSVLGTFLALRVVNSFTPLSIFALNLTTGLGLGLAIDYNLFIVSRFREELARAGDTRAALRAALRTAGRTAGFSGCIVAAALASLLAFPQPFLYSMAIGGIFTALLSAASALIVLPALLALLGPRVNSLSPRRFRSSLEPAAYGKGFWYRLSHAVMRRAPIVAVASAAVMIALGVPFLSIKFTGVNASDLPASASARQVDNALQTDFPPNRASPIYLAVDAPRAAGAQVRQYAARLRGLAGVLAVQPPQAAGADLWRVDVVSRGSALSTSSQRLVRDIRQARTPYTTLVGGETAAFVDQSDSLSARLPIGIGILVATTLLLLFALTGSVILPLKALVMNLLTLSATFGLLVLVFQDGRLQSVLGYTSQGALEETQPILLGVLGFALSTDYGVFLLTRIKELRDSGLPNTEAVAAGLERVGRLVTSAAILFCVAIGAFATSKIVFIKELGVGVALAVILDATIVRGLLVPSLMRLLGDWNWWAPAPLRRLHDRFGIRESLEQVPPATLE
ncbi:MAG: MMPL family transporter [Gaiellaceae bacterium]